MELFSGAACDFWSECHNGSLIPLPRPSASHKGRMVWDDEEGLEFAPEFQHRPWRETVDSDGEVQSTARPRARGARAVTKHMCLGPKPVADRASTYLRVRRVGRDFLVFAVPAEVPESPKALDSLTEGLTPLKPMRGVRHEMRVGPNRIRPTVRAELVPVGPIGASPVVTYHGTEVTKGGCVIGICQCHNCRGVIVDNRSWNAIWCMRRPGMGERGRVVTSLCLVRASAR